ncbi:lysase [Sarracenia purpurea var. burkii]
MREVGEERPLEGLVMIDALQRLGIDYHFQEEIDVILQKQFIKSTQMVHPQFDHLYEVSTQFRLLRQEGYNVPADVFYNFKDKAGRFKSELSTNMKGLMSLYEATQHRIKGEGILDEAAEFSSQVLRRWMSCLDHHEALLVGDVLKQRYHKCLARFIAKNFLFYNYTTSLNGWIKGLQELAKMDSIIIQSTYQKEILQISHENDAANKAIRMYNRVWCLNKKLVVKGTWEGTKRKRKRNTWNLLSSAQDRRFMNSGRETYELKMKSKELGQGGPLEKATEVDEE